MANITQDNHLYYMKERMNTTNRITSFSIEFHSTRFVNYPIQNNHKRISSLDVDLEKRDRLYNDISLYTFQKHSDCATDHSSHQSIALKTVSLHSGIPHAEAMSSAHNISLPPNPFRWYCFLTCMSYLYYNTIMIHYIYKTGVSSSSSTKNCI